MKNRDLYIIAEAALSYHGNKELAKLLVHAASIGLADAVKFQIMYADDICVQPYEYYNLFTQMELSSAAWKEIRDFSREKKVEFIAEIFGEKSFEIAKDLDADGVKIHTTIFNEKSLVDKIFSLNKKVYLSTGGLGLEEIKRFVNERPNKDQITLLHGYQAEPTELSKNYLNKIDFLKKETGCEVGFMDHEDGESPYKHALSHVALGMGVKVFEKHIAINRKFKFENAISSLNPEEFTFYVTSLKDLHTAIGEKVNFTLSVDEIKYRHKAMKKIVAKEDISPGEILAERHISYKRSDGTGECYFQEKDIVGKKTNTKIPRDTVILQEMLA